MRLPQRVLLLGTPLALAACCWLSQPFRHTLIRQTQSLQTLSRAQQVNLQVAARKLDGQVIQPAERFSFNQRMGPRTLARGYLPAPSYLGGESPATVGGGICLLSSALYQAALKTGLRIEQRVPHLRTIHSVPAGLDATVWYGGADLRFINTLSQPIRLNAEIHDHQLVLSVTGERAIPIQTLQRVVHQQNKQTLLVTVFQQGRMVSRDLYRLSP
jgi:vancomycin resistance protein VanW